jgi:hypothetical protein
LILEWQLNRSITHLALTNNGDALTQLAALTSDLKHKKYLHLFFEKRVVEVEAFYENIVYSRLNDELLLQDPAGEKTQFLFRKSGLYRSGRSADYAVLPQANEIGFVLYTGILPSQGALTRKGEILQLNSQLLPAWIAYPEFGHSSYLFDFALTKDTLYFASDSGEIGAFEVGG